MRCYFSQALTLGGRLERARRIARDVVYVTRRSVHERGPPSPHLGQSWSDCTVLLHVSADHDGCQDGGGGGVFARCSRAGCVLIAARAAAGTKLHRAGWEAGSGRVPAGGRGSHIDSGGTLSVSMLFLWCFSGWRGRLLLTIRGRLEQWPCW
jgi:hypothetical protein